jgi:hypothetical protein
LLLGGCGWWGRVGGGALGVRRTVVGGDVERRGGGGLDAKGSEAEQHGVDVARVGQGQGPVGAVVIQCEAQELGRDGACLGLVETRQGRDKIVEVVDRHINGLATFNGGLTVGTGRF